MPDTPAATPLPEMYRQMWAHAQGARGRLVSALGLQFGSQMLKLALPWMAAQAINAIQTGAAGGLRQAAVFIALTLALHVLSWGLHGPARVLERSAALQVRRSVTDRLYLKLMQAPLAWHDRHHSGDLHHRVTQAAGPLAALWFISAWTGSAALAGFVLIGSAIVRFDRALMRLAADENLADRRHAARMLDFIGNISALASLRLQAATRQLMDARLMAVFQPLARSIVITEWKWCTVDLATVALGWGLVVLGSMAANYQGLARKQADHASATLVMQAPQAMPAAAATQAGWQRITLHGLGYAHDGDDAARGGIEGVSLEIRRGERLALVGPSGSGKSTLLRVLAGLYEAHAGAVIVDGDDTPHRRHAAEWATLIPQEAEVFETTLRENLTFGQPVDEHALQAAIHASALDEVLAGLPLGLDTPMTERGGNLSGGQRQRLALARGVLAARGRSLLLLDEPTSALDPLIELHVTERLERAFEGAAIVAAVHRLSLLSRFDRVAFMAGGRLLDIGTPDEVARRQPVFAAMWRGATRATSAGA